MKTLREELKDKMLLCNGNYSELLAMCRILINDIVELREALDFYASREAMSCRLRHKDEDTPKCLTGDSKYFQDPADLPILKDGGTKARDAFDKSNRRLAELGIEGKE